MKRKSEFYGQDPAKISAVQADLIAQAAGQPDLHWAALIDAAFDYPSANEAPYWIHGINCYGGAAYEGLGKAAPVLVPLDPINDQTFLTRLLRHCYDRPMISFLASRIELKQLSELWDPLHWVTAVDHQRMLLRLADTRTLAMLPRVLKPAQWAALSGPVAQWAIIDRLGNLASLAVAEADATKVQTIHFELDQLAALLSAAEPDNVLSLLSDSMSDIFPKDMLGSMRYETVAESCELARKYEVSNWSDVVSLAVAAFLSQGQTNQEESLAAYLASKRWNVGDLGAGLVSEGFV